MSKAENIPPLRFTPSRVVGLPEVTEVVVHCDRIEVKSAGNRLSFRFTDLARWPRPTWLHRILFRMGRRRYFLAVADRDWFHAGADKFFSFYTNPRLVICMPADSPEEYKDSHFFKIQEVLRAGGFETFDLG